MIQNLTSEVKIPKLTMSTSASTRAIQLYDLQSRNLSVDIVTQVRTLRWKYLYIQATGYKYLSRLGHLPR